MMQTSIILARIRDRDVTEPAEIRFRRMQIADFIHQNPSDADSDADLLAHDLSTT